MRHEPNPEEPDRCRAMDLLITDCSGCRGSDTSLVDALQAKSWAETHDWDSDPYPSDEATRFGPAMRPVRDPVRDPFRLRTGDANPDTVIRAGRVFRAAYTGTECPLCPNPIQAGQLIVNTNQGYAHADCLGER